VIIKTILTGILFCASNISCANQTKLAVEAFYGTCLGDGPDFDRTVAAANIMKWYPLPEDMLTVLGPKQKADALKGWLVKQKEYPAKTMVVVSKREINKTTINTCSLAIVDEDGYEFQKVLSSTLNLTQVAKDNDGMQTLYMYTVKANGEDYILALILPTNRSLKSFSVTAMTHMSLEGLKQFELSK
jgi:hypothetical protein